MRKRTRVILLIVIAILQIATPIFAITLNSVYDVGTSSLSTYDLGYAITGLFDLGQIKVASPNANILPTITPPTVSSDTIILAALASDPLYPLFKMINDIQPFGIVIMYRMAFFIIALLLFLVIYKFTRHLALAGIAPLLIWGYGVAKLIIPWWGYLVLLLFELGMFAMEGRQSPQ